MDHSNISVFMQYLSFAWKNHWKLVLMQTAIANDLKPVYYLEYIFEQIQKVNDVEYETLLPWSDCLPEKCKTKK